MFTLLPFVTKYVPALDMSGTGSGKQGCFGDRTAVANAKEELSAAFVGLLHSSTESMQGKSVLNAYQRE